MSKKEKKSPLKIVISIIICLAFIACGFLFYFRQTTFTLRQYADESGSQAMFYIVDSPSGGVMVIDGGTTGNADYVRKVISKFGNQVDVWILTHPHPDHIGAFVEIYENPGNIVIKDIYTIEMDADLYQQYAEPWDDYEIFERFQSLTNGIDSLHYLHAGDTLQFFENTFQPEGLTLNVFSAYDESTIWHSTDLSNIGSLVFKLSSKNNSILFCSDVYGYDMSITLVNTYGEQLASDYLQMGHHGNNSIKEELVVAVNPKIAFFDAPDWLVNGENYDTQSNIEMIKSHGIKYYYYNTAPNKVYLR